MEALVGKLCDGCKPGVWLASARRRTPVPARIVRRARLSLQPLLVVHEKIGRWIERHSREAWLWCGRSVQVLDGSGLSMPDTDANRARWPYAGGQKPGCGFPSAQMVALFCLGTGRLVRFALDSWKAHEIPQARRLVNWIDQTSVVLTDRGFCGWGFIALLQQKGADVVMRAHQARTLKGNRMKWKKPQRNKKAWDEALWSKLPDELSVRIVRFQISVPGLRTQKIVLITTLLDTKRYPDEMLQALYRRRWAIELYFRDIKTTLGLDVLRPANHPNSLKKKSTCRWVAYNLVRALMVEAAWTHDVALERLSFKGTVDTLRQWTPLLAPKMFAYKPARQELLRIIATDQVPNRPNRSEPRARKRRPKPYPFLTKPRRKMIISSSRRKK